MDERLTTVMAQRAMHNMGIEAKQKGKLDQIAASFIYKDIRFIIKYLFYLRRILWITN